MSSNSIERYANRNPECSGKMSDEHIGEGKYKYVTKGTYDRSGAAAADKFLKTGTTFSSECFLDDQRASEAALPFVAGFHQYIDTTVYRGRVSIKVNMPQVWTQTGGHLVGQKVLRDHSLPTFKSSTPTVELPILMGLEVIVIGVGCSDRGGGYHSFCMACF